MSVANGGTLFSDETAMDHNRSFQTRSYDLTGLSLFAGTPYTVTVAMRDLVGNGAYFAADGITLEGTAILIIPEPSRASLLLISAFLLLFHRRRR